MCNKFFNEIAKQPEITAAAVCTVASVDLLVAGLLTLNVFLVMAACCFFLLRVLLKDVSDFRTRKNMEYRPLAFQPL